MYSKLPQRSVEWFAARKTFLLTASKLSAALGVNPNCSRKQLWDELKTGEERTFTEDVERIMQYGVDNEALAKADFELVSNSKFEDVGLLQHPEFPDLGVSPDGVGQFAALEIKCKLNKLPLRPETQHIPQAVAHAVFTGLTHTWLYYWHDGRGVAWKIAGDRELFQELIYAPAIAFAKNARSLAELGVVMGAECPKFRRNEKKELEASMDRFWISRNWKLTTINEAWLPDPHSPLDERQATHSNHYQPMRKRKVPDSPFTENHRVLHPLANQRDSGNPQPTTSLSLGDRPPLHPASVLSRPQSTTLVQRDFSVLDQQRITTTPTGSHSTPLRSDATNNRFPSDCYSHQQQQNAQVPPIFPLSTSLPSATATAATNYPATDCCRGPCCYGDN